MSTDKFGELDQAIADIFKESRQAPVKAKPSLADFDHETLADIFNDSVPESSNPEPSPSRVDYRGLAELFGEPSRAPIDRPPLDIDQSPHLFGDTGHGKTATHHVAERAPPPIPGSVQPNRAESLLDKIRYIFTPKADARPHVPPAAAERAPWQEAKRPLTESPLGFEPDSLLFRPADRPGDKQQTADDVADAFRDQTSETGQTNATAPPSLADIISSVSTDIQPPAPETDEQARPATVDPDEEEDAAETVATRDGEDSWQELESLLTQRSLSPFPDAVPRSPLRKASLQVFPRPDRPEREQDTAPADAESRDSATAPADPSPAIPIDATPAVPPVQDVAIDELRTGQPGDAVETERVAATPLIDIESSPLQQATSSPAEQPLGSSTELTSPPTILEADPAGAAFPDPTDYPASTAHHIPSAAPDDDDQEVAMALREDAKPLSIEDPPTLTPETESPALSDEPDHIDSAAEIAAAIPSVATGSADREPQTSTWPPRRNPSTTPSIAPINPMPAVRPYRVQVAAVQPYQATPLPMTVRSTGPSQNFDEKRTSSLHSNRLDRAEPAAETATLHLPLATQSTIPSQTKSSQADKPDAGPIAFDNSAPPVDSRLLQQDIDGRPGDHGASKPAEAIDHTPPLFSDVTPKIEAKSLLSELDLESAIRLRWVMRDIRADRMAMSPASESDLAALAELGLVEIRGDLPYLTASGVRELN